MSEEKKKKRRYGGLMQNFDNVYPWVISLGIGSPQGGAEAPAAAPVAESIDYDYHGANRMADALRTHYESHHPSMRPEHTEALVSYTKHSSIMNKHLFKKKEAIQSGEDYSDPVQDSRAEEISNAIRSSVPFKKSITVYSGMHSSIPPHLISEHGGIFHIAKFTSTSTHPDIAKRFAGKDMSGDRHIVKFDIPAFHSAGMFVGHISHKDDEHEYLIDKNQIVHIGQKLSSHKDEKGVTTHIWKGRILTDDEAKGYAKNHPLAKAEYESAMKMKGKSSSVFESIILEREYEVPNADRSLDMQRRSLPQIDIEAMKKDLAGKYTETNLKTSALVPTQKHFNFDKVDVLVKKPTNRPIVVSRDNYVIDGHHRWLSNHATSGRVNAIVVHKNAEELIDYLNKTDYTKTKTLKEADSNIENFFNEYHSITTEKDKEGNRLHSSGASTQLWDEGYGYIARIESDKKGAGSKALKELTSLADKHNVHLGLWPKADSNGRLNTSQLKSWYGRHGFEDEDDGDYMFREPKSSIHESVEHPMIDVDGEMRHVNNSEGIPIHHTDEGIRNFHRWFGDSKMVDEHGRPQVFYHGSAKEDIESFDVEKAGTVQYSDWGKGVYFTPRKFQANNYKAEAVKKNDKEYNDAYANYEALSKKDGWKDGSPQTSDETFAALNKFRSIGNKLDSTTSGKVYSSYLKLKNPYHQEYSSMNDPYLEKRAKEKGHDGIVVHTYHGKIDEVVAFHDHQIKSSESNNGEFGNNNKIHESEAPKEVWYHGTKHDIQSIDHKKFGTGHDENGPGFYMTSSPVDASSYTFERGKVAEGGNVMPVHHDIKNPMPTNHVFQRSHLEHIIRNAPNLDEKLEDWGEVNDRTREGLIQKAVSSYHSSQSLDNPRNGVKTINMLNNDFYGGEHSGELLKRINEVTGHDGVVIQRTPTVKHAIAWFPHQVKSIFGSEKE